MTQDDLEKPLMPRAGRSPRRTRRRVDGAVALACVVGAALAFVGLWAMLADDPLGGEPVAVAAIERRAPPPPHQPAQADPTAAPAAPSSPGDSAREGVPVVRPGDPMPKSGPVIIRIPGANEPAETGQASSSAVQAALLEDSRYGPLPRIGADGRRPLDVYARPQQAGAAKARVALVVAGLGVSREATEIATASLPAPVTLAFSPYGKDVAEQVEKARAQGHEVLIQAPMEPYGYPGNDTGPQTLLTSLPAPANLERLRWALGRAQGYVGVAPLGGGKFLEAEPALAPVFTELGRRGLLFAAAAGGESRADAAAEQAGLVHARPATQIDVVAEAGAIDAALADLERAAKADGAAVGWATASPLSLKRIAAWAGGLADRGVALTPITAAVRPQGPS